MIYARQTGDLPGCDKVYPDTFPPRCSTETSHYSPDTKLGCVVLDGSGEVNVSRKTRFENQTSVTGSVDRLSSKVVYRKLDCIK
jgi:hypothetical protein